MIVVLILIQVVVIKTDYNSSISNSSSNSSTNIHFMAGNVSYNGNAISQYRDVLIDYHHIKHSNNLDKNCIQQ